MKRVKIQADQTTHPALRSHVSCARQDKTSVKYPHPCPNKINRPHNCMAKKKLKQPQQLTNPCPPRTTLHHTPKTRHISLTDHIVCRCPTTWKTYSVYKRCRSSPPPALLNGPDPDPGISMSSSESAWGTTPGLERRRASVRRGGRCWKLLVVGRGGNWGYAVLGGLKRCWCDLTGGLS